MRASYWRRHRKLYLITFVGLLLVYFTLPNTYLKFYVIAFLPLIIWLPNDIKTITEKINQRKKA
ncbi:hypothetical protein BCM40_07100 [Planococcus donghaensis]|uniref:Uncharacterized protein n=1 Tax=Planococcus donghaensis TaxID=414778 RepID=A0A1C7EIF0_9BACL|nr:hypothetical protein BCM40_07100 [Planococcus donghaensis]